MRLHPLFSLTLAVVVLSGCSIERGETARAAKASMIGMTKEDVLACMGPPAQKAAEGETEVWSYPSGNGATATFSTASATGEGSAYGSAGYTHSSGSAFGYGSSYTHHRFCVVNVVMHGGAVAAVNYNGPTGGLLSRGEQCAYAVQNCVK